MTISTLHTAVENNAPLFLDETIAHPAFRWETITHVDLDTLFSGEVEVNIETGERVRVPLSAIQIDDLV